MLHDSERIGRMRPPLRWREIVMWALMGTLAVTVLVLLDVQRTGLHVANLIQPGDAGPSAAAVHEDFPELDVPDGTGHDGQQFYAVARAPMHLDEVADDLDRPTYRLQRPLYPWLAWALHPTGGGPGLVVAMAVVGAVAIFVGGVATGALAVTWGGRPWTAALFAALPGTYVSLRISTADALALALVVAALALAERRHRGLAVLAAVGAVLAKEPSLLVLAGYALWRRDRLGLALTAVPAAVAALWAGVVRLTLTEEGRGVQELTWPLKGLWDSADSWVAGDNLWALAALLLAGAAGIAGLWRHGLDHPVGWAVAASLALLLVMNDDVVGLPLNATRASMAPLLLGTVALLSPTRSRWSVQTAASV